MSVKRAQKRRKDREQAKQNELVTLTRKEINKLALEHATNYFDKMRDELVEDTRRAVATAWAYLLAKALEESYDWFYTPKKPHIGVNRVATVLEAFKNSTIELDNGDINIDDIVEDFNSRGIFVKEPEEVE